MTLACSKAVDINAATSPIACSNNVAKELCIEPNLLELAGAL